MKAASNENTEQKEHQSRTLAMSLIDKGNAFVTENRFSEARKCFEKSVRIYPTADGLTYLGWMLSFEGFYVEALDLCFKAIQIDPDFGNPYNDIGVYLLRVGRLEESIIWFQRAARAARYEPRHFAHFNLSQVYIRQGKLSRAYQQIIMALKYCPEHEQSKNLYAHLEPLIMANQDSFITH